MKNFVVLMLLLLSGAPWASAHESQAASAGIKVQETPAEALAIVEAFHAALARGDGPAAQALLDDNVQIYEQGWVERSKAEYTAHHLQSDLEFSKATSSHVTARTGTLLGDLAYVITEGEISGTYEGKGVSSITLETMVLRHASKGWQIIHVHWSSRTATKKK